MSAPLLERDGELAALDAAVSGLAAGRGAVVTVEAGGGLGTTALLDHAGRRAEDAGFTVRRAAPGPFERELPFGAVRALLEGPLRDAGRAEAGRLLDGAAGDAGRFLLGESTPGRGATVRLAHSLLWLCGALAAERPLVLILDDAHWSDRESLEVLSHLARRIDEVPVLLVAGANAADPAAPRDLLSLLAGVRATISLRPRPLTLAAAVALVRRHAGHASERAVREAHDAAGGNPWILEQVGRQIAAQGEAGGTPSAAVREAVRRRLAALTPRDRSVATALAVLLGDDAPAGIVAGLSGVPIDELAPARDALRAAGLLACGCARFAHPILAAAVVADLHGSDRGRAHREAARLLIGAGASSDEVAAHLLECGPSGDAEVSALLVDAACEATRRGDGQTAVAYLERARDERAAGDNRAVMLARLGTAAFDAELPDARRWLHEALTGSSARRVDVMTMLAALQAFDGGDARLADQLFEAAAGEHDPDARAAIDVAALDALLTLPGRQVERGRRVGELTAVAFADEALARVVTAHRAWSAIELGNAPAEACASLAMAAIEDGVLLERAASRPAYHLVVRVLILTDRHAEAARAIAALRARAGDSARLRALAAWHAGELALRTGDIREAVREARAALDDAGDAGPIGRGALAVLVRALAEQGAYTQARALLDARAAQARDARGREPGAPLGRAGAGVDAASGARVARVGMDATIRNASSRLALAAGEYERALDEARDVAARREAHAHPSPTALPWRSTGAVALAHLGRRGEALMLADDEVARAERFGAPVPLAVALHARALAEADDRKRIALLERGLEAIAPVTSVLETARLRVELGAALSRAGARVEARELLRPALADADAVGAEPLADRARRELVASGLRPRRAALEGEAALTPRQRQICALAAVGKGNREIAHALFLSIKTVETHLAAAYRKLGIGSRAELVAALA